MHALHASHALHSHHFHVALDSRNCILHQTSRREGALVGSVSSCRRLGSACSLSIMICLATLRHPLCALKMALFTLLRSSGSLSSRWFDFEFFLASRCFRVPLSISPCHPSFSAVRLWFSPAVPEWCSLCSSVPESSSLKISAGTASYQQVFRLTLMYRHPRARSKPDHSIWHCKSLQISFIRCRMNVIVFGMFFSTSSLERSRFGHGALVSGCGLRSGLSVQIRHLSVMVLGPMEYHSRRFRGGFSSRLQIVTRRTQSAGTDSVLHHLCASFSCVFCRSRIFRPSLLSTQ